MFILGVSSLLPRYFISIYCTKKEILLGELVLNSVWDIIPPWWCQMESRTPIFLWVIFLQQLERVYVPPSQITLEYIAHPAKATRVNFFIFLRNGLCTLYLISILFCCKFTLYTVQTHEHVVSEGCTIKSHKEDNDFMQGAGSSITHFPLVLCLFWISGTHLDAQFCGNNISLVSSILLSILFGREFRVLDSSVLQLPMKSGTRALVAGASVIKSKLHDSSKMFFHRLKPVFVM